MTVIDSYQCIPSVAVRVKNTYLGKYEVGWEAVPPPSKTSKSRKYYPKCEWRISDCVNLTNTLVTQQTAGGNSKFLPGKYV